MKDITRILLSTFVPGMLVLEENREKFLLQEKRKAEARDEGIEYVPRISLNLHKVSSIVVDAVLYSYPGISLIQYFSDDKITNPYLSCISLGLRAFLSYNSIKNQRRHLED